jgi:hypothetical protein
MQKGLALLLARLRQKFENQMQTRRLRPHATVKKAEIGLLKAVMAKTVSGG